MYRFAAALVLVVVVVAAPRGRQLSEDRVEQLANNVLRSSLRGTELLSIRTDGIFGRLPDNATLIRPNIVDNFSCIGRKYGYYGDVENGCQIFHVCLPLQQLYPANFTADATYIFSFICPKHTVFSQDAMVCAWESEALPCEATPELYWLNNNFFRKVPTPEGGTRYAQLNEKLDGVSN